MLYQLLQDQTPPLLPHITHQFIRYSGRPGLLELRLTIAWHNPLLNLNSFRVAVVEDDPLLRQILEDVLQDRGAECTTFANADDAMIAILGSRPPDLLITDHLVPGQLTGADLAELLAGRWPSLPIIITTGYGYDIQASLPANVVYLQKPWLSETLEDAIAQALH